MHQGRRNRYEFKKSFAGKISLASRTLDNPGVFRIPNLLEKPEFFVQKSPIFSWDRGIP